MPRKRDGHFRDPVFTVLAAILFLSIKLEFNSASHEYMQNIVHKTAINFTKYLIKIQCYINIIYNNIIYIKFIYIDIFYVTIFDLISFHIHLNIYK